MKTTPFGRTDIVPTILGLGTGGFSRIGIKSGTDTAERVVRTALDAGVNFIDSSENYGTEEAIGNALTTYPRESYYICTKYSPHRDGRIRTADELEAALDASLNRLRVEYVDVYMAHGVAPDRYQEVRDTHIPVLEKLKKKGKLRWTGITEAFSTDTDHGTLIPAANDGLFDVMMVGYNILNQSARETVLPNARANGIATLCMFAVRQALIDEAHLREYLADAKRAEQAAKVDLDRLFAVIHDELGDTPLADIAYRFARDTDGIDVILSGTGNPAHFAANVATIEAPPLPARVTEYLESAFAGVTGLSGQ